MIFFTFLYFIALTNHLIMCLIFNNKNNIANIIVNPNVHNNKVEEDYLFYFTN